MFEGQPWFIQGVVFYIIGVINNRFGSLVIDPFLKWIHFVNPCSYKDYIKAENTDSKVAVLNTENNAFRSYIAVFTLSIFALLYKTVFSSWDFLSNNINIVIFILLVILFAFSYRKQTRIISQRVKIDKK